MTWRKAARAYGFLLAPALLVYPCLYYIASADPRYRHPIEPVMLILAVYAVASAASGTPPAPSASLRAGSSKTGWGGPPRVIVK